MIDISQPLRPGIVGFPGDTGYAEQPTFTFGPGCPVNVARITLSTHCGTHADAPRHTDDEGAPIGELPLDVFVGPCRVIDARSDNRLCEPDDIRAALLGTPPRVLLRLESSVDPTKWNPSFRALSPAAVELLAENGVVLVGIDTPSIDPADSKELPSHEAANRADMRILENLVLAHVEPGDYELIALPLKLVGLDAAPVRAILRPL